MRILFTSFRAVEGYQDPLSWISRISFYTGILEQLARRHEVHSIEQVAYKGLLEHNRVHYHFTGNGSSQLLPLAQLRLIRKLAPHVIVVHGLLFPLQLLQLRAFTGPGTRIFVQHHAEQPLSGIRMFLQRRADAVVQGYFFTSGELAEPWIMKRMIHAEKLVEVMEGSTHFFPMPKLEARTRTGITGEPVFLWVGRLNPNKDPLTVVKAFLKYTRMKTKARLFMIFQTNELLEKIQILIEQHPEKNAVVLLGKRNHEELQQWYSSADFFLSGSHYEGSGIALCEAMACGCIPIVTNIPAFRKITRQGSCGLLYETGNEESLYQVLLQSGDMQVENMQTQVMEQFRRELSFEAIAQTMETAFDQKPVHGN